MKKYNFKIDSSEQNILIKVSPLIFPIPTILHAAYHFIDEAKVIVEEAGNKEIAVTFILDKKLEESELEKLAYEFNVQLISSFVEAEESQKHAGIRETIMKAALLPQALKVEKPPVSSKPKTENPPSSEDRPKT